MGLNFSLLAIVDTLLTWVVQYQTAGLMNVFFDAYYNASSVEPEFDLKRDFEKPLMEYVQNMLLIQPQSLPVLEVLPSALGGGKSGVEQANAHPNREAFIFWITISVFLLCVILIILIQTMNCCCCCLSKSDGDIVSAVSDKISAANFRHKSLLLRLSYIATLVIAVAFMVAAIMLVIVYFTATAMTISYLENHNRSIKAEGPASLIEGIRSSIEYVRAFITEGIEGGRAITYGSIIYYHNQTKNEVGEQFNVTIERTLQVMGVRNLTNMGEEAAKHLKTLIENLRNAISGIAIIKDEMNDVESLLKSAKILLRNGFGKIANCTADPTCNYLKANLSELTNPIDPKKINALPLEEFIKKLTDLLNTFQIQLGYMVALINKLYAFAADMITLVDEQINVDGVLATIEDFWKDLQKEADAFLKKLLETTDEGEQYLTKYVPYARVGFSVIGGLFIFIIGLATFAAIWLLHRAIKGRLIANPMVKSSYSKAKSGFICSKSSICCTSTLFMPMLLIFALIIGALLFTLTTVSGEGCIYLYKEGAINKTDYVMNSIISKRWDEIAGETLSQIKFISAPPPRNILQALSLYCDPEHNPTSEGLLSAVGYRNLVNISSFVHTPEVTEGIENGREIMFDAIEDAINTSTFPDNATIEQIKDYLNAISGGYNIGDLLLYIDPNKVETRFIQDYEFKLKIYINLHQPVPPQLPEALNLLNRVLIEFEQLKIDLKDMRNSLLATQDQVNIIHDSVLGFLNLLEQEIVKIQDIESMKATIGIEYDKMANELINFLTTHGEMIFSNMTKELLPCSQMNLAYSALVGTTCGDEGGIRLLTGLSYVFALNVLFIVLFYFSLLVLAFFQDLRVQMLSEVVITEEGLGTNII